MKFYTGTVAAARNYLEKDTSRADDYYLAEGTGLAERFEATPVGVVDRGPMDGDAYERWVAGYDVDTGAAKGRLLKDGGKRKPVRFVEVVVNGPKTWSLAAALHPDIGVAYDAAQGRAAQEIIGWAAQHATTRIGPKGRQVQVPIESLEAAVIRHFTSRAGDPHRHLHVQINSRVFARAKWRGLHTVGIRDSIGALNGIGHAAMMSDPEFRRVLAAHGYTLDLVTGEVEQLRTYVGVFSARTAQIARNIERYEAEWRGEHPGEQPGPRLRRAWDTRAWADARPDKVAPLGGAALARAWLEELYALGHRPPKRQVRLSATAIGGLDRDLAAGLVVDRLSARASAWNAADIRGRAEQLVAEVGIVAESAVRRELAEDLTARAVTRCERLLSRADVPEHIRALTLTRVLEVEADLNARLALRAEIEPHIGGVLVRLRGVDNAQIKALRLMVGDGPLLVIEGAAGAGKTRTLAVAAAQLARRGSRMVVVTPTRKAASVASAEIGGAASSAAWLIRQYGYRWDEDGHWGRVPTAASDGITPPDEQARLHGGDLLLVDEAGMLDQDTARVLLTIADETGARVALVGDRHQLPAVGRGGVLDLAARWVQPDAHHTLDVVHRFTDPDYADLSLRMRSGENAGRVFDKLVARGEIAVHASEAERTDALAELAAADRAPLLIADTREQVRDLNAAIRDRRLSGSDPGPAIVITESGERIGMGDRIATRRNDRDLDVSNRDTWTVTAVGSDGRLAARGRLGVRTLPAAYVAQHVELAYATTAYGAQGETVRDGHVVIGDHTGAASAYVGMTRGREHNIAHLVAEDLDDAKRQWIDVFSRDRADLGPAHATQRAAEDMERYGSQALQRAALEQARRRRNPDPYPPGLDRPRSAPEPRGIGL
ncbi:MobF family relaxase [Nocardioides sp. NPDC101246]|uniref:MobF family relaxase n=1 Tax=Nocardioides sp. NPDC101246 TaxID=3364336 RepID=UPI0038287665